MTSPDNSILGFTLPQRHVRGRLVRMGSLADEVLAAHAYPDPVGRLLAEALALTALLGDLLRPAEGQLTLQARGQGGPVGLLVADWAEGALRGYAQQELDRRSTTTEGQGTDSLAAMLGEGYLAITVDQTLTAERYQGIVALGSSSLASTAEAYFSSSEQVPTLVRLAASHGADGRWRAGGLLLQILSRAEQGGARLHVDGAPDHDWDHVHAIAATLQPAELLDPALGHEQLLWRLFHEEEVRVQPVRALRRGCRCDVDHIRSVLEQFSEEERADMRNAQGVISVDCEFCSRQFLLEV